MPNIILVAAISKNNVIGNKNQLPWHLPKDLAHFKQLTLNQNVVMGKNTFLSIINYLGKPLPKRNNIVLSSTMHIEDLHFLYLNKPSSFYNIDICNSIGMLDQKYKHSTLYVIGGQKVYEQMLPLANQLIISHVDIDCLGDAFFPNIDKIKWQPINQQDVSCNIDFTIVTYKRLIK